MMWTEDRAVEISHEGPWDPLPDDVFLLYRDGEYFLGELRDYGHSPRYVFPFATWKNPPRLISIGKAMRRLRRAVTTDELLSWCERTGVDLGDLKFERQRREYIGAPRSLDDDKVARALLILQKENAHRFTDMSANDLKFVVNGRPLHTFSVDELNALRVACDEAEAQARKLSK